MNDPARTILIADDEPHIRHIVADKLRASGFHVVEARDGEEALELALSEPPNLLITDLQMPVLSGLELCRLLKARPTTANVPALMLTARGHVLSPQDLINTNVRELISKPFGARQLVETVRTILGQAA